MTKHISPGASNTCRHSRLPSALLLLVAACQAVGDDTPANLGNTDAPQTAVPPAAEPFALDIGSFAGRWVGVAEDVLALGDPGAELEPYRFPSGSSQIVLDLFVDGIINGTLTFGEGSAPPAVEDPDVGYPVGVSYAELLRYPLEGVAAFSGDLAFERGQLPPHEGLPYSLIRPNASPESPVADGLLRLSYLNNQVLSEWCALQTPHATPYGSFSCNAGVPLDLEAGGCHLLSYPDVACVAQGPCAPLEELGPVDCDKAFLCDADVPRCQCFEAGCQASTDQAELVVRLVGDELVGVIGGAAFQNERHARAPLGTIHFRREP